MKKQTSNTARAELARLVAAVIAHPDTPVGLYNAMVDELTTWARFEWETVKEVDRILLNAANDEKEGAR